MRICPGIFGGNGGDGTAYTNYLQGIAITLREPVGATSAITLITSASTLAAREPVEGINYREVPDTGYDNPNGVILAASTNVLKLDDPASTQYQLNIGSLGWTDLGIGNAVDLMLGVAIDTTPAAVQDPCIFDQNFNGEDSVNWAGVYEHTQGNIDLIGAGAQTLVFDAYIQIPFHASSAVGDYLLIPIMHRNALEVPGNFYIDYSSAVSGGLSGEDFFEKRHTLTVLRRKFTQEDLDTGFIEIHVDGNPNVRTLYPNTYLIIDDEMSNYG